MKNNRLLKSASILMISAVAVVFSCKDEDRLSGEDSQDISEEALTDSYFQDIDEMAQVAVETPDDAEFSGGRAKAAITFTVNDSRFQCGITPLTVTLERTNTDPNTPQGVITVDFGTEGCTDLLGNTRKGKLIFAYNGRRFVTGSTVVTTTDNYSINDVKLEGTRTVTNVTVGQSPTFNVKLANGKATFADNRVATRVSDITWQWVKGTAALTDDKLIIDPASVASGTTRGGRAYEVSLLEALEYQRFCGIAVKGIKRYVLNGSKDIIIDYGDGACDRQVTISVNGKTHDVRVR
jgi:hypothetical protein